MHALPHSGAKFSRSTIFADWSSTSFLLKTFSQITAATLIVTFVLCKMADSNLSHSPSAARCSLCYISQRFVQPLTCIQFSSWLWGMLLFTLHELHLFIWGSDWGRQWSSDEHSLGVCQLLICTNCAATVSYNQRWRSALGWRAAEAHAECGVILESSSTLMAPAMFVWKKYGDIWLCVDCR